MYAIIATGGKQYKVSEGDIVNVEKLGAEAGETAVVIVNLTRKLRSKRSTADHDQSGSFKKER